MELPLLGVYCHNLLDERIQGGQDDTQRRAARPRRRCGRRPSVYERANLARRRADWPSRAARVAQVTASLHDAADHDTTAWFLIGRDGTKAVAMALVQPFRADGGSGSVDCRSLVPEPDLCPS